MLAYNCKATTGILSTVSPRGRELESENDHKVSRVVSPKSVWSRSFERDRLFAESKMKRGCCDVMRHTGIHELPLPSDGSHRLFIRCQAIAAPKAHTAEKEELLR